MNCHRAALFISTLSQVSYYLSSLAVLKFQKPPGQKPFNCNPSMTRAARLTKATEILDRIRVRMTPNILTISAACMLTAMAAARPAAAQGGLNENAVNRCRTVTENAARLRCYEESLFGSPQSGSAATARTQLLGKWRLVRTPNPQSGGKEAISIMRGAELSGSDPNFAGLMLRCGETDVEVLVILIDPLPPRAHPEVKIDGAAFDGTVTPPGAAIQLPSAVAVLAGSTWQTMPRLNFEVGESGKTVKGLVNIDGLKDALQILSTACSSR
jgi:hypothetical protein